MEAVIAKTTEMIDNLQADYKKNGFTTATVEQLKELRLVYRDEVVDPTLTKTCRLCYEFIETFGKLELEVLVTEADEEEETEAEYIETDDLFMYLLELLRDPNNKYNREEINAIKLAMKAEL
jgi:hypothetical protein